MPRVVSTLNSENGRVSVDAACSLLGRGGRAVQGTSAVGIGPPMVWASRMIHKLSWVVYAVLSSFLLFGSSMKQVNLRGLATPVRLRKRQSTLHCLRTAARGPARREERHFVIDLGSVRKIERRRRKVMISVRHISAGSQGFIKF